MTTVEEFDEAQIAQDLRLLPDFVVNVGFLRLLLPVAFSPVLTI